MNNGRLPLLPQPPSAITHSLREEALAKRLNGVPLPPPVNASAEFAGIILKACAFSPEERFGSAVQMRQALEALLQSSVASAKQQVLPAAPEDQGEDGTVWLFADMPEEGASSAPAGDAKDDGTILLFANPSGQAKAAVAPPQPEVKVQPKPKPAPQPKRKPPAPAGRMSGREKLALCLGAAAMVAVTAVCVLLSYYLAYYLALNGVINNSIFIFTSCILWPFLAGLFNGACSAWMYTAVRKRGTLLLTGLVMSVIWIMISYIMQNTLLHLALDPIQIFHFLLRYFAAASAADILLRGGMARKKAVVLAGCTLFALWNSGSFMVYDYHFAYDFGTSPAAVMPENLLSMMAGAGLSAFLFTLLPYYKKKRPVLPEKKGIVPDSCAALASVHPFLVTALMALVLGFTYELHWHLGFLWYPLCFHLLSAVCILSDAALLKQKGVQTPAAERIVGILCPPYYLFRRSRRAPLHNAFAVMSVVAFVFYLLLELWCILLNAGSL